jgi:polynucleotide 5'-hydroxyl-kinase GRC3/NOL9
MAAQRIQQQRWCRILVLGAIDRGKSTYCGFLGRTLSEAGFKVAFVDADVGQKDVGPPGTISLAYLDNVTGLSRTYHLTALYFVGAVSPIGHFLPIVVGTKRMVEIARADFVIVDTTGLITGSGRVLKIFQIDSVRPHVIIALEKGQELETLLKACRHYNIIRLRSSPHVTAKSPEARKAAREQAFRTYFQNAKEWRVPLKRLVIQRGSPSSLAENLLCGLADRRGEGLGLAIVRTVDMHRGRVSLLTPVARQAVRVLQLGDLYLDATNGRELLKTKNALSS